MMNDFRMIGLLGTMKNLMLFIFLFKSDFLDLDLAVPVLF